MLPPVGKTVQYFSNGSRTEKPTAAMVVEHNGDSMVWLNLFTRYGGECRGTRPLFHIDDKRLAANPLIAMKDGAWDWLPGEGPTAITAPDEVRVTAKPVAKKTSNSQPATDADILRMSEEGKTPKEIAQELGGNYTAMGVGRALSRLRKVTA